MPAWDVAGMLEVLDRSISPQAAQQGNQGKYRGAGGGTPPSQPVVEMASAASKEPRVRLCFGNKDVCGGDVAKDKTRFCWCKVEPGLTRCGKTSHQGKAAGFYLNHAYICAPTTRGPSGEVAFLTPSLDLSTISEEHVQMLRNSDGKSVAAWTRIFAAIEENPLLSLTDLSMMLEQVSTPVSFAVKTPPRKRPPPQDEISIKAKRITYEEDKAELEDLTAMDRDEALSVIVETWGDLRKLMSTYRSSLNLVGESLNRIDEADIPALDEKVGRIHASLGEVPHDYDAPATSAWGTIVALGAELAQTATDLDSLEIQTRTVKRHQTELDGSVQTAITGLVEIVQETGQRVLRLESAKDRGEVPLGNVGTSGFEEDMMREMSSHRERLAILERANLSLTARLNQESVTMGGVTFQSQDECQVWVAKNICPANFYDFYDVISLLEQSVDSMITYKELSDTESKTRKLNLTATAHRILNSFSREVPLLFMKGPGTVDNPLTKIPNHDAWDHGDGQGGLKNEISHFLVRQVEASEQAIEARFQGYEQAAVKRVAIACLQESNLFIQELCNFITSFYNEMVTTSNGQFEESWTLTCKLVKGIFFELNLVRTIAARAPDILDDMTRRVGLLLWGTLRAHKVMREFKTAQFRRHLSLAPTLMLHLFKTRVPVSIIKKMQTEVSELAKSTKLSKVTADRALEMSTKKK